MLWASLRRTHPIRLDTNDDALTLNARSASERGEAGSPRTALAHRAARGGLCAQRSLVERERRQQHPALSGHWLEHPQLDDLPNYKLAHARRDLVCWQESGVHRTTRAAAPSARNVHLDKGATRLHAANVGLEATADLQVLQSQWLACRFLFTPATPCALSRLAWWIEAHAEARRSGLRLDDVASEAAADDGLWILQ